MQNLYQKSNFVYTIIILFPLNCERGRFLALLAFIKLIELIWIQLNNVFNKLACENIFFYIT